MSVFKLDGLQFSEMILQGAEHLADHSKVIDALNVFPVPDGDTGTNMSLSLSSGASEVKKQSSSHIGEVGKALSKGLLMGARGNSGVILSQLFRGFAKAIEQKASIDSEEFAFGLVEGVEMAYKAVMKPVEGTILTVAKDAATQALTIAKAEKDLVKVMKAVLTEAKQSLDRTPNLLPILKQVGVVDSGGQGLVTVYEGFLAVLKGESLPKISIAAPSMDELVYAEHHKSAQSHVQTADIEFGYCTEFMVSFDQNTHFDEETFSHDLSKYGDSLLVVANDDLVKVHIHAEQPGEVLTYGQKYGSLLQMKIENMRQQHATIVNESKQKHQATVTRNQYGVVAISMGDGIAELFKSIGTTVVIEGGQTMNPSTEDIANAIKETHADTVFILPNNSNVMMAAKQAALITDGEIVVIETKTIPQGISALLAFNPDTSTEANEQTMTSAIAQVKTGQVTTAVRDTEIEGVRIKKDEYMGIFDGKIVVADQDVQAATLALLDKMVEKGEDEMITIFQGKGITEQDIQVLTTKIEKRFADIEIEVHAGGQPLYPYLLSVE